MENQQKLLIARLAAQADKAIGAAWRITEAKGASKAAKDAAWVKACRLKKMWETARKTILN